MIKISDPITVKKVLEQFPNKRFIALAYVNLANEFRKYKNMIEEYESITGIYPKDLKNWRKEE